MADLTLDERLFLLSRAPSGRDRSLTGRITTPLAGATLAALHDLGAIEVADGHVVARRGQELSRWHLENVRNVVADTYRWRTVSYWLDRLPWLVPLQENVGCSLAERRIVRDGRHRMLAVPIKRFPPSDLGTVQRVSREMLDVLTRIDAEPEPPDRLLAGLVSSAGLVASLVEPADRRFADRRARQYLRESSIGAAVARSVAIEWNCPRASLAALAHFRQL